MPRCALCEQPIEDFQRAYRRIEGWEQPRMQGGANQIVLREVVANIFAHPMCIEKRKRGIGPEQAVLA